MQASPRSYTQASLGTDPSLILVAGLPASPFEYQITNFVNFGRTGLIHPKEITSDEDYGQGDIVKVHIVFRKDPKGRISFLVDGDVVGVTSWKFEQAYFALSVDENSSKHCVVFVFEILFID